MSSVNTENQDHKVLDYNKREHDSRKALLVWEVLKNKVRRNCEEGSPEILSALQRLRQEADSALNVSLQSVMAKGTIPPSGSKHDYMSLSVYTWPNPDTPDGLPYKIRDGLINPEVENYDRPKMTLMSEAVETLAIAYYYTRDKRYSKKAVELIRTWFLDPDTSMNPNMLYAQYIPGKGDFDIPKAYYPVFVPGNNREGIYVSLGGVIEGCSFPAFLDCIELLEESHCWNEKERSDIKEWFRSYMIWLLESQHGKDEASTHNNHGSWYCNQVTAYAVFSGELDIARRILTENVPKRIQMQIEPDGSQPTELYRAISFHYVVFGLTSFFNLALLGERVGVDLWNYETSDGRSLKKAIDWLMPYLEGEKEWTHPQVKPINYKAVIPLLHMAERAYGESRYTKVIGKIKDYEQDHRYRLLY